MKSKKIQPLPTIAELENMMNKPSTSAEDKELIKRVIDHVSEYGNKFNVFVEFTPEEYIELKKNIEEIRVK